MADIQTPVADENLGTPPGTEEPQTQERPTQVEGDGSAPVSVNGKNGDIDWKNKYFAQQRVTEKLSKQIEDLNKWREQFSQPAQPQAASAPNPQVDIFTDPETFVRNEVKKSLSTDLKQEFDKQRLEAQQVKAEEYILSQDYIDPESEETKTELKEIFKQRGFAHAWNSDPFAVAEGVLEIYKARKGIGKSTPPKAQAGMVPSGASQNPNGRKVWTSREVNSLSLADYEKYREDINAAVKEGRYKE